MSERVRIGELLLETGLITQEQLNAALKIQQDDPRRLGEILVSENMVSEAKVTQILSQQLSVPWVSLEYVDFSRQLLNLVSSETAQQHTLVPIYVRRSKQRRETLYVAIEDPSNQEALDEVADYSGLPVRPMIAPSSDIRAAIRAYYLGLAPEPTPEPPMISEPPPRAPAGSRPPPPPSAMPRRTPSVPAQSTAPALPAEPDEIEPESDPDPDPDGADAVPESEDVAPRGSAIPTPSNPDRGMPKMITLTMLDGTQVILPAAPGARAQDDSPTELTARDLVEALRAGASGQDVSAVLGAEVDFQRMFAALLSLMLKKHLILDWEFVRELKR
jgi:type IV pilus assembly protein PilB